MALQEPGGRTESKSLHEGIVLESLTTAPIDELGGVKFTFDRGSDRFIRSTELSNPSRWTGQLFQLVDKDDGVDGVAASLDSSVVTVYLIQVRSLSLQLPMTVAPLW
jgi:hypothetical protein